MTTVLLFVEHELDDREVTATLRALAELQGEGRDKVDVTVLVPCATHRLVALSDVLVAAHGTPASWALGDARHDVALARTSARRTMEHVLAAVRARGHRASGELVAVREEVQDIVREAAARRATTVLVASSPHRLSHLLHRDLEHRLRRAGIPHVRRLDGVDAPRPMESNGPGHP